MKYKLMLSTFLVLFLAIVPSALANSIWYVDGMHGGDSNDCKSFRPLQDHWACHHARFFWRFGLCG